MVEKNEFKYGTTISSNNKPTIPSSNDEITVTIQNYLDFKKKVLL